MELNCLYDTEITPKYIFNSMKKNIYKNFSNTTFSSISKEYLSIRKNLFSLIKKISNRMGFKSQTYFLSIYYLDILFTQNKKIDCNHNILGLACLLLSAKYCENDPAVPELKYFIKIYNRIVGSKNSISVSDLFYSEVITIKMLNHKLNYYTVYDFNSFFFSHNILKKEQLEDLNIDYDKNQNKDIKISIKAKKILEKIYRKSRYYLDILLESPICLKYNTILLSIYIMKKSIENTLLNEKNFDKYDFSLKDKYLKKTNEYFKNIIKGYYNIDYENIQEYPKLLEEYDFIKIFKQIKKVREDFSPINNIKGNNISTSFNKTPNKSFNMKIKPLNQRIAEITFSSTKKNFNKLKSSNSIHSKMNSTASLLSFSGQNLPRVSYNQNINLNQKTLFRNLGIDNCNENYRQKNFNKENNFSEKKTNSDNEKNKLLFLCRLNSQNSLNYNLRLENKKSEFMLEKSPFKLGDSEKNLKENNFGKYNDNMKKDSFMKITKIKNFYNNNYNKSVEKNSFNQNINNINVNINLNKPYSKKVVQNFGNKLKSFNHIPNKSNLDMSNNDDSNLNINKKNNGKTKQIDNVVKKVPKYKINNNINKEEINRDLKNKININKKYSFNINKEINISNTQNDFKEKYEDKSKNKEKKISKLLHINLNPKLLNNTNTPLSSLFVQKKNKDDFFSSTTYINKTNSKNKIFDTNTVKSTNNLAKSIDNKINNFRINNSNHNTNNFLLEKSSGLNLKLNDIQIKVNNNDRKIFNFENKKSNYFLDSNENIFSHTLTSSQNQKGVYSLMSLKLDKEKEKEKINNKANNKIILTDYTTSDNENMNNIEEDINDLIEVGNISKFHNTTLKSQLFSDSKRIQVKKNNFENEINKGDNYMNFKKLKHRIFRGFSNQNSDFKNFEESNDEDSNNFNHKNLLIYSFKNNQIEDDNNLNNIAQQFKKNPSTIVINNNININFGNKTNFGLKDKKRYKHLIKNSHIQINNNNGPNSISSLLHKIPLCYKNSKANINVRKKNIINISNK